jgi:D-tyrosyl-tRNA(Tyr) deacylase
MRAVVQRVAEASVSLPGGERRSIGRGLLVLVGVGPDDDDAGARRLAGKVADLRVFPDERGRFDRSLSEVGGEALVVSQFTLYGDCRKGRRPDFTGAAAPELAEPLVRAFAEALGARGVPVRTGEFGARMRVALVNDGPVTLALGWEA